VQSEPAPWKSSRYVEERALLKGVIAGKGRVQGKGKEGGRRGGKKTVGKNLSGKEIKISGTSKRRVGRSRRGGFSKKNMCTKGGGGRGGIGLQVLGNNQSSTAKKVISLKENNVEKNFEGGGKAQREGNPKRLAGIGRRMSFPKEARKVWN